ncbi:MAG: hypothetical protein PVJ67_00565 [Candidatus Pacearchaeota archaeon]|jgi:predicted protein tyrosine phosphatase
MKPKVLCICTMGLNRSKYIAEYLREKGYETRYGGIGPCRVDPEPANPVKKKDLDWADIIIAAREKHKPILKNDFGIKNKKIITLEVSDSRKKAAETHPEFKDIDQKKFNEVWTYPKLRQALEEHLPLGRYL